MNNITMYRCCTKLFIVKTGISFLLINFWAENCCVEISRFKKYQIWLNPFQLGPEAYGGKRNKLFPSLGKLIFLNFTEYKVFPYYFLCNYITLFSLLHRWMKIILIISYTDQSLSKVCHSIPIYSDGSENRANTLFWNTTVTVNSSDPALCLLGFCSLTFNFSSCKPAQLILTENGKTDSIRHRDTEFYLFGADVICLLKSEQMSTM